MSDDITEARFQLYLALEGVRQSNDPDSIPGTEYAESLLKSADAYAMAYVDAAETAAIAGFGASGCNCGRHHTWNNDALLGLRARIGQGQSPGTVQQDVPSGPDTNPGS